MMTGTTKTVPFRPIPGFSSPHVQTIMASLSWPGNPPHSEPFRVSLDDGDALCCEVSTPAAWHPAQKTMIMIHGLGGSHASGYMIRLSRKLCAAGYRIVRLNLRGCGSGLGLSRRPYHGGASHDVLSVIRALKVETPLSPCVLIGFSLGGNIALKLAGELGSSNLVHETIAICPPIDLAETADLLEHASNRFYQHYYLNKMRESGRQWFEKRSIRSIREFDDTVTAPQWDFRNAADYYNQCSSRFFLSRIKHPCHILFAQDDPFISYRTALETPLSELVKIWLSPKGGHMGFLGWAGRQHGCFWLDQLLLSWIDGR